MSPRRFGLIAIGLAGLPLIAMVLAWQLGSDTRSDQGRTAAPVTGVPQRVGDTRDAALMSLTASYIARGEEVSDRVKSGREYAPIQFLNEQLERKGEKWRVRDIEGLIANTYDVS